MKKIKLENEMSWETSINDPKIDPCLGNNIMESIRKYLHEFMCNGGVCDLKTKEDVCTRQGRNVRD